MGRPQRNDNTLDSIRNTRQLLLRRIHGLSQQLARIGAGDHRRRRLVLVDVFPGVKKRSTLATLRRIAASLNPSSTQMNKRQAYSLGIDSGLESAQYGDFTPAELADEESFAAACSDCCSNKRQYADSPTYDFAQERNADSLFDAFDDGESAGIAKGWRKWYAAAAAKRQAMDDALDGSFDGLFAR